MSLSSLQVLNASPYVAEHGCQWGCLSLRCCRWPSVRRASDRALVGHLPPPLLMCSGFDDFF
ncbi:hypothetical protein B5G54_20895 [Ralstonia solanacearum]|nr:hypothetical protein B5G54_20895 [Ralstonia solanacearum]OPK49386.1 hypothetical protein B5S37_21665 [Ralstonia solanacearum]OPK52654.1 hypothetical protein B5J95_17135 [Ralstonia solanacearum]